jgi:hypothetical protein
LLSRISPASPIASTGAPSACAQSGIVILIQHCVRFATTAALLP